MPVRSTDLLTKTRFKLASECPRKLFYAARPGLYADRKHTDDFLAALAEGGHQVGALARCLYPEGELVATLDAAQAVAGTEALLARDHVIIHEPAIQVGDFFLRVDVLVKRGTEVDLVEVKAKSVDPAAPGFWDRRDPGRLRKRWLPYLDDVAFQTWVTRQAHPDWTVRPHLMLVDRTTPTDVDGLHQLFRIVERNGRAEVELTAPPTPARLGRPILVALDVAREVDAIIAGEGRDPVADPRGARPMQQRATGYADLWRTGRRDPIDVGPRCKACEFRTDAGHLDAGHPDAGHPDGEKRSGFDLCWRENLGDRYDPAEPHVFAIWNTRKTGNWLARGIHRMRDVPLNELGPRQKLQATMATGRLSKPEDIAPGLADALAAWEFPLHFVDFETIAPAIPFHAGLRPYQALAFQFSCHRVAADGTITHDQWLAPDIGAYPNHEFLLRLRASLGDEGTVLRYGAHEDTILRHLADQLGDGVRPTPDGYPTDEVLDWIDALTTGGDRAMVDMLDLVKGHYYHRRMGGSNSIKAVLPAVLEAGRELEKLYARPLPFGTDLVGRTLWKRAPDTGRVRDPYELLPPLFDDLDLDQLAFLDVDERLKDGGAAMVAWSRMQSCEMSDDERRAIADGLRRYCELDTLAMVMIYQHWMARLGGDREGAG